MRLGSLCSGIGGLELGLERAGMGRTVWHAEIDPDASAVLARRWPGVPNLGDLRAADWSAVEPVDVLTAGFPCQPVSSAGRRRGTDDERWLFDDIAEAVGRMDPRPRLLVFENVRGLLSANGGDALARVVQGLAALGFVGRYGLLRASDVGACHRRERVFIVAADAHGEGLEGPEPAGGRDVSAGGGGAAADPGAGGRGAGEPHLRAGEPDPAGGAAAHAEGERRGQRERPRPDVEHDGPQPAHLGEGADRGDTDAPPWGPYAPAVARWAALTRPAPPPTENGRLSPRFVEWMQGFPEGWTDGLSRTAALRVLGNAVVPQVSELLGRMILGAGGGCAVPHEGALLPTPTAEHPGGSLEGYHARLRDARPGTDPGFVPLNMLVEQVLA